VDHPTLPFAPEPPALRVEVVRSARRRRTVQAVLRGDVVRVHMPAHMSAEDERRYVDELVRRLARTHRSHGVDLAERAARLAGRYRLPRPASIAWSDRQRSRWGSCSTGSADIRMSRRLAEFPPWVLDYVLVHELAHLVHADHSPAFWALVDRYPRAERARGFLIAKGDEPDEPDGSDDG
jgi:predicted metal-dependent hydrolase